MNKPQEKAVITVLAGFGCTDCSQFCSLRIHIAGDIIAGQLGILEKIAGLLGITGKNIGW
jgi:hypothetical protein